MKVMVIVKASKSSEAGDPPSEELMMEMGKFNEELVRAGIMKAGDGLRSSSQGKRVHFYGQEGMLQAGFESKIMHSTLKVGKMNLMASDGCNDKSRFDGFRLALSVDSEADCDRVFGAMSEGGTIDVPLMRTFWSPRYGMLTDKFGVGWMVMKTGENQ